MLSKFGDCHPFVRPFRPPLSSAPFVPFNRGVATQGSRSQRNRCRKRFWSALELRFKPFYNRARVCLPRKAKPAGTAKGLKRVICSRL